jgi:hydrogenase nickel incorporation protein HypA/HybF
MHESSITESILKNVIEKATESNAKSVKKIKLVIGQDTGFMGDSIQFYFDKYSEGTIAQGALLDILFIKSKLKCTKCGNIFERKKFSFECPDCGGEGVPTKIGKECYIESIEIEENV